MYHIDTMTQKYIIWYQNNIKNHHITNPNQQFSLYWCPHWNTMGISTPWNLMIQIRLFWITPDIIWYTIIILGLWCIICSCIIIYAYNCNNICNCKVTLHKVKEVGAVMEKEINSECRTLAYISLVLTILGLATVALLHYR